MYASEEENINIILCNTLNGNNDIYIGEYSLEYEDKMCK